MKRLQDALQKNKPLLGIWSALAGPYATEVTATGGFDWMLIDCEHGPNDVRSVLSQLQVLAAYPIHPVVRIPNSDASLIKRYLDIGATNLLAPFVNSAADAEHLVRATRYPPAGVRGSGAGLGRVSRWGDRQDYLAGANDEITLIVQIETREALQNLDDICAVDGVSGVFFGPADIASSIGKLGQSMDQEVTALVLSGVKRAAELGVPSGVYVSDHGFLKACADAGAILFGVASDTGLLASGARRTALEMANVLKS